MRAERLWASCRTAVKACPGFLAPRHASHAPESAAAGNQRISADVAVDAADKYVVKPIRANSGYIGVRKGPGHNLSGRLSPAKTKSLAGDFVNPDGSTFYPGGTSW